MDENSIAIVSVCMNDGKVLPQFIENMRLWDDRFHHVFIDNGSRDNTLDLIREHFRSASVIESPSNLGTTGAYNIGIKLAEDDGADFLLFLALDTLFPPGCLNALVDEMARCPDIGAAGPVLLKSHDRTLIECMGFNIHDDWTFHPNYGGQRVPLRLPDTLDADYIDGGSALFRVSALRETGLLDENLFMYGEDVDICLRLKQKGYRVIASGRARAWHRHSEIRLTDARPRPYQVFYQHRNQVYLAKKYKSRVRMPAYYLGLIKRLPRKLAYFAVREHSLMLALIYIESLWNGLSGRMGKTKYVQ